MNNLLFSLALLVNIVFGLLRYVVWPLFLIMVFGPFGLLVWLFIH